MAGYKGVDRLPNGYEVTVSDVFGALEKQGWSEDSICDGDALFFRNGWSQLWSQPEEYSNSPPGIGFEVARWVEARNATLIGSDSWTSGPNGCRRFRELSRGGNGFESLGMGIDLRI